MKPEEFYKKEFGDADSVSKESVIKLLNHFAKVLEINRNVSSKQTDVSGSLHIDFAVYITGHDKETIEQKYNEWRQ